jgi:hypothetical protein
MNSACAYPKFGPELSTCTANNKHRFHIKEANFILYLSLQNNTVLDDVFVHIAKIHYQETSSENTAEE